MCRARVQAQHRRTFTALALQGAWLGTCGRLGHVRAAHALHCTDNGRSHAAQHSTWVVLEPIHIHLYAPDSALSSQLPPGSRRRRLAARETYVGHNNTTRAASVNLHQASAPHIWWPPPSTLLPRPQPDPKQKASTCGRTHQLLALSLSVSAPNATRALASSCCCFSSLPPGPPCEVAAAVSPPPPSARGMC